MLTFQYSIIYSGVHGC